MTYAVHFERVGRKHDLDATLQADNAHDLAAEVFRFARKHLASRWFDVGLDMDERRGWIESGRFGVFTFEATQS